MDIHMDIYDFCGQLDMDMNIDQYACLNHNRYPYGYSSMLIHLLTLGHEYP